MKEFLLSFSAFLVAFPLSIFIFKPSRNVGWERAQISVVLGLSLASFVFILQTRFAWLLLLVTALVVFFIVVIEFLLRCLVRESEKLHINVENGVNGTFVSFDKAKIDSGCYPEDYLTEVLWSEMHNFHEERNKQQRYYERLKVSVDSAQTQKLSQSLHQIYRNISIKGPNYSITEGIRNTSSSKKSSSHNRILIFGGSTVFCDEMPDRFTNASFLQELINAWGGRQYEVINCGWCGATVLDRAMMLRDIEDLHAGDIVVFYFGDNDSGWHYQIKNRLYETENLIPPIIRSMKLLKSRFGLEIAGWVYQELAPKWMQRYANLTVAATLDALSGANDFCKSKSAHLVAILQPNIYTLRTKYPSEIQAEKRFSSSLKAQILYAYRQYEEYLKKTAYSVSAIKIFDGAEAPVFLDWSHVNARGNEVIANFIFEELQIRGLLNRVSDL